MDAKTNFLEVFFRCFFRMRFYMDFELFFGGSKLEKSLKTIVFSMVLAKFHRIDVFEKVTKNTSILPSFSEAKMEKIRKKWN